jgi:hypothetical protein
MSDAPLVLDAGATSEVFRVRAFASAADGWPCINAGTRVRTWVISASEELMGRDGRSVAGWPGEIRTSSKSSAVTRRRAALDVGVDKTAPLGAYHAVLRSVVVLGRRCRTTQRQPCNWQHGGIFDEHKRSR